MSVVHVEVNKDGQYGHFTSDKLLDDQYAARHIRLAINKYRAICRVGRMDVGGAPVRCALCKESLYVRRKPFGTDGFLFSHYKTDDVGLIKCPQREGNHLPESLIRALKYQGAEESNKHRNLKFLIAEILRGDASIPIDSIKVESTISEQGEWRRPDVQALLGGYMTAFEVQVSTEMASMIAAREYFYERFGRILWILDRFDPATINQSQADILTSNNEHLFVLDEEACITSKEKGILHLKAWIHWPTLVENRMVWRWIERPATIHEIRFSDGHPYLIDVASEVKRLQGQIDSCIVEPVENVEVAVNSVGSGKASSSQGYTFSSDIHDDWISWRDRYESICNALVNTCSRSKLREDVLNTANWRNQTETASGLWLALYGVYLDRCNLSDFVIKALICASNGRLDYGYSSWKYIINGIIKSHIGWFSPIYSLIKQNVDFSEYQYAIEEPHVKIAISDLRQKPIMLTDMQRAFFKLFTCNRSAFNPKVELDAWDSNGPRFPYFSFWQDGSASITPPELARVHMYVQNREKVKYLGGRPSSNIGLILDDLCINDKFIPFPNLPIPESTSTYYAENNDIKLALIFWENQLQKIEKQLDRYLTRSYF